MPYYQYVEIGTSDFDTICQSSAETSLGISMDPLRIYLDRLPNKVGNIKVEAALVDQKGVERSVYWLPPEIIRTHRLPGWLRGCNSIGAPHRMVLESLKSHNLPVDLIRSQRCVCMTPSDFMEKYRVDGVGVLKFDTEGMDSILVASWINHCGSTLTLYPIVIWWECNSLSTPAQFADTYRLLSGHGYALHSRSRSECIMMRDEEQGTALLHELGVRVAK